MIRRMMICCLLFSLNVAAQGHVVNYDTASRVTRHISAIYPSVRHRIKQNIPEIWKDKHYAVPLQTSF